MLKRPRALLAALALTGVLAVGVLIATVLKLWGPWPPTHGERATSPRYWGGFGGVIWAGCSVLLACVCMAVAARPRRRAHYALVLAAAAAMAGFGIGTGALWTHAGIRDCARGFCRIAIAVLALSDALFAAWVLVFGAAAWAFTRKEATPPRYATTTERVSRDVPRKASQDTPDTSCGKSSLNPTLTAGVPVLTAGTAGIASTAAPGSGVPTSPLPPPPGISSSPPSRTVALKDTLSSLRSQRMRREGTESTTASLIPYLSPYDLDTLQSMQPGKHTRQRSTDAERTDEPTPFEVKNVSFGKRSGGSGKKARKPLDGLWKQ